MQAPHDTQDQPAHHVNTLTRMGNQIATFFASMPNVAEAQLDLATHLKKFWEPRMRRAFLAQIDAGDTADLHPLLLSSVQQHRSMLE
jgi:formate dehydrogenase subunit delta